MRTDAEGGSGNGSSSTETAHAFLRRVTSSWHQRTEEAFARFDVSTLVGLRGFLFAQSRAVLPLEAAIEAQGIADLVSDWPSRQRSATLCQDLRRLGTAPAEPLPAVLPSRSQALGALYVLEGSRLGGAILHRQVLNSPNPIVRGTVGFFGHKAGPQGWRRFIECVEGYGRDKSARTEMQIGAETAFSMFHEAARSA